MTEGSKPARRVIDWEAIEKEFRAGQLSVCQIARQHEITEAYVRKEAKKRGWERNLSDRVRKEVEARLARDIEEPELAPAQEFEDGASEGANSNHASSNEARIRTEAQAVELAAARGVEVVRSHRGDIRDQRCLVRSLVVELRDVTAPETLEELDQAIDDIQDAKTKAKRRVALERALSLSNRAGTMKDLALSSKILVELERQAFNLDDPLEKAAPSSGPAFVLNIHRGS